MPASRNHFSNTTESAEEHLPKRAVRATQAQLNSLKIAFEESSRPSKEAKDALAERTGLTPTWVNNWFMRTRKKSESSIKKDIGVDNSTEGSPHPRHPSVISESSASTMTAPTSRAPSRAPSLSNVTDWSVFYSNPSSAPSPSSRPSTAGLLPDESYNPSYMNRPYDMSPPQSYYASPHAYPNQSFITTTSTSTYSTGNAIPRSHSHSQSHDQFPPYPSHSSLDYNSQNEHAPLGYADYYPRFASSLPPLPRRHGVDARRALAPQESGQHMGAILHEMGAEAESASARVCANVKDEPALSEGVLRENADAGDVGSETEEEATPYLGPASISRASEYGVLKNEALEKGKGEDEAGESEGSMSEAAAWKKAQQHPQFETLLRIAGVRGPFKLTEDGLVLERG